MKRGRGSDVTARRAWRVGAFAGGVMLAVTIQSATHADETVLRFQPDLVTNCLAVAGPDQDQAQTCIGLAAKACMEQPGGFSTVGMGQCLAREYDLWDGLLNEYYGQVMAAARGADTRMAGLGSAATEQATALRDAQRRWIDWRDAACAYEYSRWGGGTGGGPASAQCMLTLTARQVLWLDQYRSSK
ncbi:MAG: DUF1311 domain-containing protein [Paracoccus sp. (in: a-proteobacteria)]|nr:DUF1311 domain-containing protein [Paracoccus sp. (in: a-proteobacteria)]